MDSEFRVGIYVRQLHLEQDVHLLPWIHLILHFFPHHLLPNLTFGFYQSITVTFSTAGYSESEDGIPGDQHCAPPSIYHGLPRRLPLTPLRLAHVYVKNTTFRSFQGCMSLVSGIGARLQLRRRVQRQL